MKLDYIYIKKKVKRYYEYLSLIFCKMISNISNLNEMYLHSFSLFFFLFFF